jgi:hypothetical protein
VVTIDICKACGAPNSPAAEFCSNCNEFLAWDRTSLIPTVGHAAAPPPYGPSPSINVAPPPPVVTSEPATPAAPPGDIGHYLPFPAQPQVSHGGSDAQAASAGEAVLPSQPTVDPTGLRCPQCGQSNPGTRRFCLKCGFGIRPAGPADDGRQGRAMGAAAGPAGWLAFRPWLMGFGGGTMVLVLIWAGMAWGRDLVSMSKDLWWGLTKQYVEVSPLQAGLEPPKAASGRSDPAKLVDRTAEEFTMKWPQEGDPKGEPSCGAAPGTGWIVVTMPRPVRIRQILIHPGLDEKNPRRTLQPMPQRVGVRFDDGLCQALNLPNPVSALSIDSGRPVTRVRIGIMSASTGPDLEPRISITEIGLRAYPG